MINVKMYAYTYLYSIFYIYTYIYISNFTDQPIACVYYVVHINKGILKPGKSNTLGITKVKFLMHNHDCRSCAMVIFIFLSNITEKKYKRSSYLPPFRILE